MATWTIHIDDSGNPTGGDAGPANLEHVKHGHTITFTSDKNSKKDHYIEFRNAGSPNSYLSLFLPATKSVTLAVDRSAGKGHQWEYEVIDTSAHPANRGGGHVIIIGN